MNEAYFFDETKAGNQKSGDNGVISESTEARDHAADASFAASLISSYFDELDVLKKEDPIAINFLFLSQEDFDRRYPHLRGTDGLHTTGSEQVVVVEQGDRLREFMITLHELVHAHAFEEEKRLPSGRMYQRSGYMLSDTSSRTRKFHFHGLNEAIVEMMKLSIALHSEKEIISKFGLSQADMEDEYSRPAYRSLVETLTTLIGRFAEETQSDPREMREKIERGQLTGEMMWMREVDSVFGDGSLRVLDSLVAWPKTDSEEKQNEKVLKYFQMKGALERAAFQSEIY